MNFSTTPKSELSEGRVSSIGLALTKYRIHRCIRDD